MWFILLFAVCGLAVPIALEIHVRGKDNILTRSGSDLARSAIGRKLARATGVTAAWINSILALAALFALCWAAFRLLSWLLALVF
ncbi:hypothetical protein [Stenotrophomonas acidaminiphila]|jgi:hypothetical protein|uniref:hypothetical protein n=1 Tax=Stenotrophomonas acidaminiphila TaxID=128780 RepID=UPI001AC65744|nr:hypothetical protein [Stenotrophomonas acidaminiphila]MBN8801051.1 hypothetical protein [Stenotrophomonas acidaminiphila]MDF9441407.1 hypothetical protein [Stenotrophomonas acidaminiphila]WHL19001.1 hypothetical protein QLF99_00680 [Stenotrophomonas acidaminiphila]